MNAAQLQLDNLERFGAYDAIWFEGRAYTNREIYELACQMAGVLRARGAQPGDRILLIMLNSPAVYAAFIAIWKIGAVMVPVTPMWTAREVRYVLQDSGARLVITSPELAARLTEASADLPDFDGILVYGSKETASTANTINLAAELATVPPFGPLVERAPEDLAMLLYTSGTTGNPKGVMLSHDNMIFVADAAYEINRAAGRVRTMQVLPLSHVYGVITMNLGLRMGNWVYVLKHFDAGRVLATLESFGVQRLAVVPTMLTLLINHPDRAKYNYQALELVGSGGAALPEAARQEFAQLFDCAVKQGYGLSETGGALSSYRTDEAYRVGSVGRALPGVEVCAMDFYNQPLPPGETGELCTRGRHVMQGYFNNPTATADAVIDGWLHTGDIGRVDADGYVFITDRKKDLIIKGGENISPHEIEEGLYTHPAVAEATVIGVPDPVYGENLLAAVVCKPGQQLSEAELKEHLTTYVTKFKIPARIVFLDTLPKGSSGKILKRALRDQFSE